jgi:hypothetical protein
LPANPQCPQATISIHLAREYARYLGLGVSITVRRFSGFVAGAILGTVIGLVVGDSFRRRLTANAGSRAGA